MGLANLKPAAGEGRGVAGGVLLSVLLHPAALVLVGMLGSWIDPRDGYLLVVPFMAVLGVTQWTYLGPTAWILRRRGWVATAKGVMIGGAFVALITLLGYGYMYLLTVRNVAEVKRIQRNQAEHPTDYISTDGIVTLVDDKHFEFRRDDTGDVVSLLTWNGLDYVYLKKNGGYEKKTRDILKPDVRVSVDYSQERGKPPLDASIVRVYEDGARR